MMPNDHNARDVGNHTFRGRESEPPRRERSSQTRGNWSFRKCPTAHVPSISIRLYPPDGCGRLRASRVVSPPLIAATIGSSSARGSLRAAPKPARSVAPRSSTSRGFLASGGFHRLTEQASALCLGMVPSAGHDRIGVGRQAKNVHRSFDKSEGFSKRRFGSHHVARL